ncbi:MAG: tripartite tricarboxylate transporter TctB family protein [Spirochaetaceae bacterium]|nr:tripartite tricarboxylate transporter TctB family protein [Spirochaetaceae bacterium]
MEFNPVIAGIAAGVAFVLSFLLGLISGAPVSAVLLRALFFSAIFFVLTALSFVLFEKFLNIKKMPEFFSDKGSEDEEAQTGQRVDMYDEYEDADSSNADSEDGQNNDSESLTKDIYGGVEQNDDLQYTSGEDTDISFEASEDTEFAGNENASLDKDDFVPGLPGVNDGSSVEYEDAPVENTGVETVEMSVGRTDSKIELSDLGDNVDGHKVAQAIQTLLRKDEG